MKYQENHRKMTKPETWVRLVSHIPQTNYLISNLGNIKHADTERCLERKIKSSSTQRYGGEIVNLFSEKDHRHHSVYVSRLMKQLMPPQPTPKHMIYHKDGNRKNNALDNLEWKTLSEIIKEGLKLKRRPIPERHPPLTFDEMKQITLLHKKGISQVRIGQLVGRHNSTISKFLSGKRF